MALDLSNYVVEEVLGLVSYCCITVPSATPTFSRASPLLSPSAIDFCGTATRRAERGGVGGWAPAVYCEH